MFWTILISVFTLMHVYVFWRAASIPLVDRHLSQWLFIGAGIFLWAILFLSRFFGHGNTGTLAWALELLGMTWMGVLLLVSVSFFAVDLVTGFGFVFPRLAISLRGWALLAGAGLSLIALVQGFRPPVVQDYEVHLHGLPDDMDGTVVVGMSDLHIGSLLGRRWLAARVAQVQALRPDLVVLLGDLFEGHGLPQENLLSTVRQLSAPLGVWAVPGNHESYGNNSGLSLVQKAGFRVLRNQWVQLRSGFIVAGLDDLTVHRRAGREGDPVAQALSGRLPGATILLSHTPWEAEKAAGAGVGLMLSGHTHGGQIWPFGYLVGRVYPLLAGQYDVGGMVVIVCRGTGTWGPRMRLWRPGEILRVTLRQKPGKEENGESDLHM
jgi:predicted MPP superfamily phosphohydrolase